MSRHLVFLDTLGKDKRVALPRPQTLPDLRPWQMPIQSPFGADPEGKQQKIVSSLNIAKLYLINTDLKVDVTMMNGNCLNK